MPNTADQGYQLRYLFTYTAFNAIILSSRFKLSIKVPTFNGTNQVICAMTPDYNTIGFESVNGTYWWCRGTAETTFGTEVYYSVDFGTTWTQIDGPLTTDFYGNNQH